MKNINLKFIILLILLPLILITLNPLLISIFDESYLRYIIKHTIFNLDSFSFELHNLVNQLEAEADEIYEDFLNADDLKLASELLIQWQNTINTLNSVVGANNENIIIEENNPNVHNDDIQDAIDDETEALAAEIEQEELLNDLSYVTGQPVEHLNEQLQAENSNNMFNPDEIIATSTPNTTSHELDVNTHSSVSESLIPFLLILIHQNLLTKLNKVKTKWIKLVTTPIIIGKLKRGRQSNIIKYIKYLSIFLTFTFLISLSLLFYPSLLENIDLNYLLLILTNILDYITNHFYSLYCYCRDFYYSINFTDNTSKIITPDTKLVSDYNDNSDTIDNKDNIDSTPFYKTKTFIIFTVVVASSALIYLYFNNLLPIPYDSGVNNIQNVDRYLEVIQQQAIRFNQLQNNYLDLLNENNNLVEYRERYFGLINHVHVLTEGLEQNAENIDFIVDHLEHLVNTEDFLGRLTDSSDSGYNS
jgi:hypothetical protein